MSKIVRYFQYVKDEIPYVTQDSSPTIKSITEFH